MVNSGSLAALLSGPRQVEKPTTEDEAVQDLVSRTRVTLQGSIGHWRHYAKLDIAPQEIVEEHRQSIRHAVAEKAAFNAMTPEERRRHLESGLKELRKDPGFVEMRVAGGKIIDARVQGRKLDVSR